MHRTQINVSTGERTVIYYSQEEIDAANVAAAVEAKAKRKQEIKNRLTQIDNISVRAMRANQTGRGKPEDDAKLAAYEDEAETLRAELATL